ncbi:Cytochrome P450 monooxygenase atE [Lasiodiplodia theobromae]|uniref:Cytochrome P450 monooxygenase atE n=1 Tax=Lasiodiplodia theobromae TaxID=45133 RepID=A0A5N5CTU9_9PEZI|nr:Cytochrome P450 monooxygenase atE [Lasiodiplodia theobromae]
MALLTLATDFSASPMLLGGLLFLLLAYLSSVVLRIGSRPAHLPPGPPTVPFWGNLKQLSHNHYPERLYTEWAKTYGPVYTVMKGSQPWIIVTGAAEAHDLFHVRGSATAGRTSSRMELAMRDGYWPQFLSGPQWRDARKLWHAVLNVGAARQYQPLQELEAKQLIADVARDGKNWKAHMERYAGSLAMTLMNGKRVPTAGGDDQTVREIVDDFDVFMQHLNRTAWLDNVPGFWRVPAWMVPARREAARIAARHRALIMRHWDETKRRMAAGLSLPCFNRTIMERLSASRKGDGEYEGLAERVSEIQAAEIGELLVTGATETTSATLKNWIAAMTLFPDAQRKAQEELDRVVGPHRLPDAADAENLPYVRQVIQETHRWLTAAPLAMTHSTTVDIPWGPNYLIPAGTPLVLNAYGIHRDPALYPDPLRFDPDRWAGKLEAANSLADDRVGARSEALYAFGAGRRICPGQHVAEQGLFLAVARWLWAFDTQAVEGGEERFQGVDNYKPGLVVSLDRVEAVVRPRSEERKKLAVEVWERERAEFLDEDGQFCRSPEALESVMGRAVGGGA